MDDHEGLGRLAGWLFADVLLVLALIGLSQGTFDSSSGAAPTVSPTTRPTSATPSTPPKPKPKPKPEPSREALNLKAHVFTVRTDRSVSDQVQRELKRSGNSGRRVGFVIALANDEQPSNRAEALSKNVVGQLKRQIPTVFGGAAYRAYWRGGSYGQVKLELFFFQTRN